MHDARFRTAAVLFVLVAATIAAGCARRVVVVAPRPQPDVVVVESGRSSPRSIRVPPGHYPPPGQCRLWHAGRPPGRQPAPVACSRLRGSVPRGTFVLYNNNAWDTDYDWRIREKQKKGSVPTVILDLTVAFWK